MKKVFLVSKDVLGFMWNLNSETSVMFPPLPNRTFFLFFITSVLLYQDIIFQLEIYDTDQKKYFISLIIL